MKKHLTLAAISAALLISPTQAFAQDAADLAEEDITATVRYVLPLMLEAVSRKCAPHLAADGFMATNGDMLLVKYSEGSAVHWPAAKQVFIAIGEDKEPGSTAIFNELPDSAVKPLMDAIIPQMLLEEVKPESCPVIERTLELIEPLPADNVAALGGLFFTMSQEEEAHEDGG